MQVSYITAVLLSYSILIAGVIGIFRFAQISSVYRPFIYLIWAGCITELLSTYFAYVYHNNMAVSAIYSLFESVLLLWFFRRLGTFNNQNKVFYTLFAAFVMIWIADTFFSSHFNVRVTFYFDIVYAFVVVLLSIKTLNRFLITEREFLKHPVFLICIALIIFFTYQVIVQVFWLYGLSGTGYFRKSVQTIMILVNFLTNLIFALAVLWMQEKRSLSLGFETSDEQPQASRSI